MEFSSLFLGGDISYSSFLQTLVLSIVDAASLFFMDHSLHPLQTRNILADRASSTMRATRKDGYSAYPRFLTIFVHNLSSDSLFPQISHFCIFALFYEIMYCGLEFYFFLTPSGRNIPLSGNGGHRNPSCGNRSSICGSSSKNKLTIWATTTMIFWSRHKFSLCSNHQISTFGL